MSVFIVREAFIIDDAIFRKILVGSYPRLVPIDYQVSSPLLGLLGLVNAPSFSKVVDESYIIHSLT